MSLRVAELLGLGEADVLKDPLAVELEAAAKDARVVNRLRRTLGMDCIGDGESEYDAWSARLRGVLLDRPSSDRGDLTATLEDRRRSLNESHESALGSLRALGRPPLPKYVEGPGSPLTEDVVLACRQTAAVLHKEVLKRRAYIARECSELRQIWRDVIPGDHVRWFELLPPHAIRSGLESLTDYKGPTPLSDASMRSTRVTLSKWRAVRAVLRPQNTSRRSARKCCMMSPFVAALDIDLPLLDFLGGLDLAKVECTCHAAWLPSSTKDWLGAADAAAKRILESAVGTYAGERHFDAKRPRPVGSYCELLHHYASCACVELLVPALSFPPGFFTETHRITCGNLRAFRFRRFGRGLLLKHAPRGSLPRHMTKHRSWWWAVFGIDGTVVGTSDHLLEILGDKPDEEKVYVDFIREYKMYTLEVPIARRSLAGVFAQARAVVPAWADGAAALKLSRVDPPPNTHGVRIHYRESEAPFHFNLFLSQSRLSKSKYRLIASEDSDFEDEDEDDFDY